MGNADSLTIRPMDRHDNGSWLKMWTAYLGHNEIEMSLMEKVLLFRRLTAKSTDVAVQIAIANGKPIGFAQYAVRDRTRDCDKSFEVQDVYVDSEWQGTGVGRALIQSIYQRADRQQVSVVTWPTSENLLRGRTMMDARAVKSPFLYEEMAV